MLIDQHSWYRHHLRKRVASLVRQRIFHSDVGDDRNDYVNYDDDYH